MEISPLHNSQHSLKRVFFMRFASLVAGLALLTAVFAGRDFYQILGVSRNASDKEIKAAYRQLSKKYHPDKNSGDDSAQAKFMEIGGAYEVLIDAEKRKIYDTYGEEALKQGGQPGGGHGGFADMFSQFFNGGQPQGKPKAQALGVGVGATLEDYFNGKASDVAIMVTDLCDKCQGSGSNDGKLHKCSTCKGRGRIRKTQQMGHGMVQQFEMPCQACRGSGQQIKNPCKKCHGKAVVDREKIINVHVTPGTKPGVEILEGQGSRFPNVEPGDIQIVFQEDPSGNMGYRRVGANLYRTEAISLNESLRGGWSREIDFLDHYNPKLTLTREPGELTPDGFVQHIHGKGMPLADDPDDFGDLFIEYRVVYPLGMAHSKFDKMLKDEL